VFFLDVVHLIAYAISSIIAAKMVHARIHLSLESNTREKIIVWLIKNHMMLLDKNDTAKVENEKQLILSMENFNLMRVLSKDSISKNVYKNSISKAINIASEPFVDHGRIELTHYFVEQSV